MNWPTKKLGEVLEYEQPTDYIVSSTEYRDEYLVPVLTAGKSFILGNTNEKNGVFSKEKLPVIIFDDFTTATKFVDFPFKVKSSAMKILHAKKNEADIKFLFYKMQTIGFAHDQHKRYWISEYSNLEIPLPPIGEQRKIVAKIEKLFAKIGEAERLRAESSATSAALVPSALHEIFSRAEKEGWDQKFFDEIVEIITTRNTREKLPYVGMEDIEAHSGNFFGSRDPKEVKSTTFHFDARHILYGKLRPYLSKVFAPDFEGHCTTEFLPLLPKREFLTREWLAVWLRCEETVNDIMATATGTRMPRANMDKVKEFKIPLPPIVEQKKFVAYLDSLSQKSRELQNLQSQTVADFSALRQSILHNAFHS